MTSALADSFPVDTGPCEAAVTGVLPAHLTELVPIDARFLAILSRQQADCPTSGLAWTLVEIGGDELLHSGSGREDLLAGLVHIETDGNLAPDTMHVLEVTDSFSMESPWSTTFVTSSNTAEAIDEVPSVTVARIYVDHDRGGEYLWSALLSVQHAPSTRQLSLLYLYGGSLEGTTYRSAVLASEFGLVSAYVNWTTTEPAETACFSASQEDEAGRNGDRSDLACDDLPEVARCSSIPTRSCGHWAFLTGVLAIARRRSGELKSRQSR
jgi:hypothetical protein